MKAAAIRQIDDAVRLMIEERPDPVAGPGEVLVRIHASALNYRDMMLARGIIPVADGRIPMTDGAGEVVAVGEGVDRFRPGDRLMSLFYPRWVSGGPTAEVTEVVTGHHIDGMAAQFVAAPAGSFTHMPEGWSFAEAATLPCAALTAWRALMVESKIRPGDSLLVQGTGGVSIFALQFAKAMGVRVIATTSSPQKADRLRALGADHVIDYRADPEWGRMVLDLTGGRGVDTVLEIGGVGTLDQSLASARIGGNVALIGAMTGWSGEVSTGLAIARNVTMKGLTVGSRQDQEDMVRALQTNAIRPVIDRCFALEAISDAFDWQAAGAHVGKVVLQF
ncbi:zinc-dependent alcohol dehydrogenase family protein [Sphingobium tyrosinilyticum]|uniref:NAD(P)-dependent alcohol dehydrogenase n=1 Tax=Sphingobium tyrosinilyticum TaxID=2715436 RepID=A0ABV9F1Q0_9SPHN